jgi:histone H4
MARTMQTAHRSGRVFRDNVEGITKTNVRQLAARTPQTARRSRWVIRDNVEGITKADVRRLARRGGVKRLSGMIYGETRGVLKQFLEGVIRDAATYMECANRKTVSALDVVHALKRRGHTIYGFGG